MTLQDDINKTHTEGVNIWKRIRALLVTERGLERLNAKRRERLRKQHPTHIVMYDSVEVSQIPTIPEGPQAVAGYDDGKFQTLKELIKRFPHAHRLSISVFPSDNADCLDIETGDATPDQAPAWVHRQKALGKHRPCVYANRSTMPSVERALLAAGINLWEVRRWIADYTGVPHFLPGADAVQWTDRADKKNCDASICKGDFFS
jgi:hypothetical protein